MSQPKASAAPPALILFAHGSRDPEWAQPFRKILRAVEARAPGMAVALAFLEFIDPPLEGAVAQLTAAGHERIIVAPLFMGQGGHLKRDLPKILDGLRADHPGVELSLLPALGDIDVILAAISDWLVSAAAH